MPQLAVVAGYIVARECVHVLFGALLDHYPELGRKLHTGGGHSWLFRNLVQNIFGHPCWVPNSGKEERQPWGLVDGAHEVATLEQAWQGLAGPPLVAMPLPVP